MPSGRYSERTEPPTPYFVNTELPKELSRKKRNTKKRKRKKRKKRNTKKRKFGQPLLPMTLTKFPNPTHTKSATRRPARFLPQFSTTWDT
ncbi:hypothetical protein TVAG_140140 [Trichomonas vaginalis G3]|uniref:Uncharacterized protein n=1 Tax=Trichomonas vaginalis (strain ATCC PRA-98 / G3) TaxID=412133 RepID=A2F6F7_TRIV3|nr:hypothetical protein TVAG_140140 [Trichomonas vaginalis G3]|eukprot:XP_001312445.1 hypothetical protein [Trichomonas vaginalis G3]